VLDPRTASKYSSFLFGLKYGELFNRRALLVQGVGGVSEEALRALLTPLAPVEVLRMAPELDGAFVVLGGDEDARVELRKRVIRELAETTWQGHALSAREMDASLVGVHALDEHTLTVELETPLPYFLHVTKYYTAMPVPRHVLERLVRAGKNPELWTRPEHIVSNGAYVLKEAKFRQSMLFEKNPRYWDAAHVKMPRVRVSMIESYNTVLNMYEAGELDSIGSTAVLPAEFLSVLSTKRDFHSAPYLSVYFYWLNVKAPPLDDSRVRQALRFAVDRESLVTNVTRAGQIPSSDIVPPGLAGYPGLHSAVFDPERARALLREAGYGPEHPLPKLTLRYNTAEGHKQVAEAVQAMWHQNLGIDVEIENQEWKVYLKSIQTHDYQIARFGWIGDYPDPYTFLELFASHNGNNHSNWGSDAYDALLDRANRQRDPQARLAVLARAEQQLMDAAPIVPMYVYTRAELIKPYLRGHVLNTENRHFWKHWWIDERWYHGTPSIELPHGFPPLPAPDAGAD
jgi:oligopeptide transport system substrate-binding protein